MKTKLPKKLPRNGSALAAKMRKGGPMKHRLEPKKGATNKQAEILEDANRALEEISCERCGDVAFICNALSHTPLSDTDHMLPFLGREGCRNEDCGNKRRPCPSCSDD